MEIVLLLLDTYFQSEEFVRLCACVCTRTHKNDWRHVWGQSPKIWHDHTPFPYKKDMIVEQMTQFWFGLCACYCFALFWLRNISFSVSTPTKTKENKQFFFRFKSSTHRRFQVRVRKYSNQHYKSCDQWLCFSLSHVECSSKLVAFSLLCNIETCVLFCLPSLLCLPFNSFHFHLAT